MANCPDGLSWWRVVNAQGKIRAREGAQWQRELLENEGIEFDSRGRIDLDAHLWQGPDI